MRIFLAFILLTLSVGSSAKESPVEAFLGKTFGSSVPPAHMLWLNNQQREQASDILGRRFSALRVRYWSTGNCSSWVLEEIGKEEPITIGVVVTANQIDRIEILEYRESRGGEVQYPFFTEQFSGAYLDNSRAPYQLDRTIDGISGATLSVRAVKKVAKLALFFHQLIDTPKPDDKQKN